jgi:hypothetical protein
MKTPRIWHFLRAWWGGYFWQRCESCNRPFGGHEPEHVLETSPFGGIRTCNHPACVKLVSASNTRARRARQIEELAKTDPYSADLFRQMDTERGLMLRLLGER